MDLDHRPPHLASATLLLAGATVALTAVAYGATRTQDEGAAPPSKLDADAVRAEVVELAAAVSERRGLAIGDAIDVDVLEPDAFRAALRTQMLELQPEGHFEHTPAAYRLFGILPADFDGSLLDALVAGPGSSVVGLFSPTRRAILVPDRFDHPLYRRASAAAQRRELLAHEIQHALQDRRWPMTEAFGRGAVNHDARLAANALLEGDAVATGMDVLLAEAGSSFAAIDGDVEARVRDQIELSSALGAIDTGALADPSFQTFSYATGVGLVQRLVAVGGWERVDAAFDAPPASTEQVLHPTKYLDEVDWPTAIDLDLEAVTELAGWTVVASDTFGELVLREFFASELAPDDVVRASFGWDGDRWLLLRREEDGANALLWSSVWDSRIDARDAFDAIADAMRLDEMSTDGDHARDMTRAAGSTYLERSGNRVALCVGIDAPGARASKGQQQGVFAVERALEAPLVFDERDEREGRGDGRTTRRLQREALAALESGRVVVDGLEVRVQDLELTFELPSENWTVSTETPLAAVRLIAIRGSDRTANFNVSAAPSDGIDVHATLEATRGFIEQSFQGVDIEFAEVLDDPRGPVFEMRYAADLGGGRAWFRQLGFERGDTFVFLTCTSIGAAIEGDLATAFDTFLDSATFGPRRM